MSGEKGRYRRAYLRAPPNMEGVPGGVYWVEIRSRERSQALRFESDTFSS